MIQNTWKKNLFIHSNVYHDTQHMYMEYRRRVNKKLRHQRLKQRKQQSHCQIQKRDSNGNVTYDCVWFGRYPQSDATGKKKRCD